MGLIGKHNIKDTSTNLIDYYLSHGYNDCRLWTGIKGKEQLSIPVSEFSGRDPRHRKELHIGDILFYREFSSGWPIIKIVSIRYLEPNSEGVGWCIDYVFENKYKGIYSSRAQDLFVNPV